MGHTVPYFNVSAKLAVFLLCVLAAAEGMAHDLYPRKGALGAEVRHSSVHTLARSFTFFLICLGVSVTKMALLVLLALILVLLPCTNDIKAG